MQANVLHGGPHNGQATRFRGEHVDLIGALPHIAEQTLNGIGGLDVPMQTLRKGIKRQKVVFILHQASHGFRIALSILGLERQQLGHRVLLRRLLPDAHQFALHLLSLSSRNGIQHVALLMNQTALARRGRIHLGDRGKQPLMPIRDKQIDLGCPSCSQVVQQAEPSLFALFGTCSQGQHFFVARFINAQRRQNDRGIGLFPMANAEMHAIEVHDTPLRTQRSFALGLKLLSQRLIEATDGTGTGSKTHQCLSHCADLVGARS